MLTYISTHITLAVGRIHSRLQSFQSIKALLAIFVKQVQALEFALWQLLSSIRSVNQAEGVQLDLLADLVGAPSRSGRSDASYRLRIHAQTLINRSLGTSVDVYAISKALVSTWNVSGQPAVLEDPKSPAFAEVACTPPGSILSSTVECKELARELSQSGAAGVRFIVRSQPQPLANSFRFAGAGVTGAANGFSNGLFVGAYDK